MTDETNVAPATDAAAAAPVASNEPISFNEAVESLAKRRQAEEAAAQPGAAEKPATSRAPDGKFAAKAETESSPTAEHDAGPEAVPGEEAETVDQEAPELPPIEPPRSWSKEDKELFNGLPRETQERLADRERSRESDFLKRQQDAAEQKKAAEAERTKAEQTTRNAAQMLQAELMKDFSDIKSHEDVVKLATEDPFRYSAFQARMQSLNALQQQIAAQEQQSKQEAESRFKSWSDEQDETFAKKFPEFKDPERAPKARSMVTNYLTKTVGVDVDALPGLWTNDLFRDARFQQVIYDAARFHAAQERAKSAVAVAKPPVQRPGASPARPSTTEATIQALEAKFAAAKTTREQIDAAAALRAAKRAAAA